MERALKTVEIRGEECACDDPHFVFRVVIANEVVSEETIDCETPTAEDEIAALTDQQMVLVDAASAEGKPWRAVSFCPGCRKGVVVIGVQQRALNVLAQREPDDPRPPVMATCGHECIATPRTMSRLEDPQVDNVSVCTPCFDADPERWLSS